MWRVLRVFAVGAAGVTARLGCPARQSSLQLLTNIPAQGGAGRETDPRLLAGGGGGTTATVRKRRATRVNFGTNLN